MKPGFVIRSARRAEWDGRLNAGRNIVIDRLGAVSHRLCRGKTFFLDQITGDVSLNRTLRVGFFAFIRTAIIKVNNVFGLVLPKRIAAGTLTRGFSLRRVPAFVFSATLGFGLCFRFNPQFRSKVLQNDIHQYVLISFAGKNAGPMKQAGLIESRVIFKGV